MDSSLKGFYAEIEKGQDSVFWREMTSRMRAFEARVISQLISDPPEKIPELQGKIRAIREIMDYPEVIKKAILAKGTTA